MVRLRLPLTLLAVALLIAGCTTEGAQTASSGSKASKVNAMVQSPPGSEVTPTASRATSRSTSIR